MKYINLIKCIVLALLVTDFLACGQSSNATVVNLPINAQSINVSLDPTFSGSSASVTILGTTTNSIDSRTGSEIIYNTSPGSRAVTISYGNLATNVLATTTCDIDNNYCTIVVSNTIAPENFEGTGNATYYAVMLQEVLTHEIGHTFGLGHWSDPTYIMYAYENNNNVSESGLDTFVSDLSNFRANGPSTGYPILGTTSTGDTAEDDDNDEVIILNYHPPTTIPVTVPSATPMVVL